MTTSNQIRSGNRALEYLVSHHRPLDAKIGPLVDALPVLGNELYGHAQKAGQVLRQNIHTNRVARSARIISALFKGSANEADLIALCIFDLELCVYFDMVFSCCGDKEATSLLVDSLLYQATGYQASSPSDYEILDEGTHKARGIQKYVLSRQQLKFKGDIEAWVFGKEVSAILHGNAKDLATILGVSTFSILVRVEARKKCAFSLYGALPTEAEQNAFRVRLEEMNKQLTGMINKIS